MTRKTGRPDIAELQRAYAYDPVTGWLTYARSRQGVNIGERAGSWDSKGYRKVWYRGQFYREHRLIFAIHMGAWPAGEVDHRNNVRSDNRWENLREATRTQNEVNTMRPNMHGVKGVDFHRPTSKWRARIHVAKGKRKYLGSFDTPEAAHEAYCAAARAIYGEFARTQMAYLD